jgi:hypothetical protein
MDGATSTPIYAIGLLLMSYLKIACSRFFGEISEHKKIELAEQANLKKTPNRKPLERKYF